MNNKGVTLVALVVTIIIMLILATISLNASIGENGIISKSIKSKMAEERKEVVNNVVSGIKRFDYYENVSGDKGQSVFSVNYIGDLQKYINGRINGLYKSKNDGKSYVYVSNERGSYTVAFNEDGTLFNSYSGIYAVKGNFNTPVFMKSNETLQFVSDEEVVWTISENDETNPVAQIDIVTGEVTRLREGSFRIKALSLDGKEVASFVVNDDISAIYASDTSNTNNNIEEKIELGNGVYGTISGTGNNLTFTVYAVSGSNGIMNTYNKYLDVENGTKGINLNEFKEKYNKDYKIENVKTIIVKDGIREIDSSAFLNFSNCTTLLLGKDIETIGAHAFVETKEKIIRQYISGGVVKKEKELYCVQDADGFTKSEVIGLTKLNSLVYNASALKNYYMFTTYTKSTLSSIDAAENLITEFTIMGADNTVIGNTVKEIPKYFYGQNTKIKYIELPQSVTTIGNYAFYGCENLHNAVFNEGLTVIGDSAFKKADLYSISIPNSVRQIMAYAFSYQKNVKSLDWGKGNIELGESAFSSCVFPKLVIPSNVKLNKTSFSNVTTEEVVLSEGIDVIPNSCFYHIRNAKRVVFPSTLTSIGNSAFTLSEVEEVIFNEDAVFTVGDYAFMYSYLKNLRLPKGVQWLGDRAFATVEDTDHYDELYYDCENCTSDHFITNGSSGYPFYRIDKNNFLYRNIVGNVTKITIGPHVKQLHSDIFRHADIEEITIPSNVEYICGVDPEYNVLHGDFSDFDPAFTNCLKLKIINVQKNYEDLHIGAPWINLSKGKSITIKWLDREETYTKE